MGRRHRGPTTRAVDRGADHAERATAAGDGRGGRPADRAVDHAACGRVGPDRRRRLEPVAVRSPRRRRHTAEPGGAAPWCCIPAGGRPVLCVGRHPHQAGSAPDAEARHGAADQHRCGPHDLERPGRREPTLPYPRHAGFGHRVAGAQWSPRRHSVAVPVDRAEAWRRDAGQSRPGVPAADGPHPVAAAAPGSRTTPDGDGWRAAASSRGRCWCHADGVAAHPARLSAPDRTTGRRRTDAWRTPSTGSRRGSPASAPFAHGRHDG